MNAELKARVAAVEMLILDVDGVLTDGSIIYADDGRELKTFHARDGSGLKLWQRVGRRAAVISGRSSPAVTRRAAELGLDPVLLGRPEKKPALRELLAATDTDAARAAVIGDDLPDLPLLLACGVAVAPADACREVRAAADFVTPSPGGRGAVREAVEWLLRGQGLWDGLVESFRRA